MNKILNWKTTFYLAILWIVGLYLLLLYYNPLMGLVIIGLFISVAAIFRVAYEAFTIYDKKYDEITFYNGKKQ